LSLLRGRLLDASQDSLSLQLRSGKNRLVDRFDNQHLLEVCGFYHDAGSQAGFTIFEEVKTGIYDRVDALLRGNRWTEEDPSEGSGMSGMVASSIRSGGNAY
jgi:hypothetical protein